MDCHRFFDDPLKDYREPLQNINKNINFKTNETVVIIQREYAITNASSAKPVLATRGAGPCIILAIYDKKNKVALLTHIDAGSKVNSLQRPIGHLSLQDCEAHIYGGRDIDVSNEKSLEIIKFLNEKNISIVNADVSRDESREPASLAIDARTGDIYTPIKPEHIEMNQDIQHRSEKIIKTTEEFIIESENFITQQQQLTIDSTSTYEDFKSTNELPINEIYCELPRRDYFNLAKVNLSTVVSSLFSSKEQPQPKEQNTSGLSIFQKFQKLTNRG